MKATTTDLAGALAAVREHAATLRDRLAALRREASDLTKERHAVEYAPLTWPDREAMIAATVADAAARYAHDAEIFVRRYGLDHVGLDPINFQRLAFNRNTKFSEADGEVSWGFMCFVGGDLVKTGLARLLEPLMSNDDSGISLAERRQRVDIINTRLTVIKEESARLVDEIRLLNPSTIEESA